MKKYLLPVIFCIISLFSVVVYAQELPTSVINAPGNNTWTNDTTPGINFTLTHNNDTILDYVVYVDGASDLTGNASNNTLTSVNLSVLSEGSHAIIVESENDWGNKSNSSEVIIYVDVTAPNITINAPNNDTWVSDSTPEVDFTLTDNLDGTLDYVVYVDGASDLIGNASNNTLTSVNLSVLSEGNHTVIVEVTDEVGYKTNSSGWIIKVDTLAPNTSDNFNASEWMEFTNFTVVLTAADNYSGINFTLHYITYPNGTNSSNSTNTSFIVSVQGKNIIHYYSKDNASNIESMHNVSLWLDAYAPVYFNATYDTVMHAGENETISIIWDEVSLTSCNLYVNGTFNSSFNVVNHSTTCNVTYTPSQDDSSLNFTIEAVDTFNRTTNVTISANVTIPCGYGMTENLTLTNNLIGCNGTGIEILSDSITFDCAGYLISSENNGTGITITGFDNVTVRNCNISGFETGVYLNGTANSEIMNSTISNNSIVGIRILGSSDTQVYDNIFLLNTGLGIEIDDNGSVNSNRTLIYNNNITSGNNAITIEGAEETQIYLNKIYNHTGYAVNIDSALNTIIYQNSIYNNTVQVNDSSANLTTTLYSNNKGNYWGHENCSYFEIGVDASPNSLVDLYPYNEDNFGGTWGAIDPYACVHEGSFAFSVNNGTAMINSTSVVTLYLSNLTNLNSTNVTVEVLNESEGGNVPSGTAIFYLNITADTNGTSTIVFKIYNDTFDDLGADTDEIYVYADHGSGYGSRIQTNYLGNDGEFYLFSFQTTSYSIFTPTYITTQQRRSTGGGGSGGAAVRMLTYMEGNNITIENMRYETIAFYIGSKVYKVSITMVYENKVVFNIQSPFIRVEMFKGQTLPVDVNIDGKDDILLTLHNNSMYNRANVTIDLLSSAKSVWSPPVERQIAELIENSEPVIDESLNGAGTELHEAAKEITEEAKIGILKYLLISTLVLAGGTGILIYRKNKRRK